MKELTAFLIAACLVAITVPEHVSASSKPVTAIQAAHKVVYHIGLATTLEANSCSATAIGPNALLTATHCELGTDEIMIEELSDDATDNDGVATIVSHVRDKADHTIFFISGQSFKDWATVKLDDPFEQGEEVFSFGNPAEWTNIYTRGYVQGTQSDNSLAAAIGAGTPDEVLLDIPVWHGDSGAAVFNSKGEDIGVLTGTDSPQKDAPKSAFIYRFGFTQKQIDEAVKFTAPSFVQPKKDASDNKDDKDNEK